MDKCASPGLWCFVEIYVVFLQAALLFAAVVGTLMVGISVAMWLASGWSRFSYWLDEKIIGEGAKQRREARRKAAIDRMFR